MSNEQISVPSLVVILVLSGLIIRYLFFSSAGQGQAGNRRDSVSATLAREAAAERIQQMFPQVDRRTALWDLQMNGGNIASTTERILSGRMETPPVTFQPPPPPTANPPGSSAAGHGSQGPPASAAKRVEKPAQPDLIARYNLQDKVVGHDSADEAAKSDSTKAWSSNRDERQLLLQRRRDQMILEARRKMEAKIAAEKAAGAAPRV